MLSLSRVFVSFLLASLPIGFVEINTQNLSQQRLCCRTFLWGTYRAKSYGTGMTPLMRLFSYLIN